MTTEGLLSLIAARRYAKSGEGKAIRERAGLSMGAVGRAAGVTGTSVKGWESGKFMPSGTAAVLWVELLDALAEQERLAGERAQTA